MVGVRAWRVHCPGRERCIAAPLRRYSVCPTPHCRVLLDTARRSQTTLGPRVLLVRVRGVCCPEYGIGPQSRSP
eukprot:10196838-Alexandrium_andersonii.AAC.1